MANKIVEIKRNGDVKATPATFNQSPFPSENCMLFQVFFLSHDQSQNVEVIETDEIDYQEIIYRLKMGESVFIKSKNPETFKTKLKRRKETEKKPWYFNRF